MVKSSDTGFAFHDQLWFFYERNKNKIKSRYNDLTKKFLAYNDSQDNKTPFLRKPQFEALEMYVFIKEFMNNAQVYQMFDDWRKHAGRFDDESYYSVRRDGQATLFDMPTENQMETVFEQMKKYRESYSNYIYALTMGLGKTILVATCIFYEFLLAKKYPKDDRYCHNAIVFAPDKTVLQSLREIIEFDKTKVVPPEYAQVLDTNIKVHFLDESGTSLNTLDDSDFNIIITNVQKIIVKKKRKADKPADVLFKGGLLSTVYGDDDELDESTLVDNQRFKKLCRLNHLGVYVDEAHHLFGADLEKQIRSAKGEKTSLRDTINMLAENTSIVACYNYTGTPYVNRQLLPEVVYSYGLHESIKKGYLKKAKPISFTNVKEEGFLRESIMRFWKEYGGKTYEGLPPKLAIFASKVEEADQIVRPAVERTLSELGIPISKVMVNVDDPKITTNEDLRNFIDLDVPGTVGSEKQFIILVGRGKEGWNCRSLFGVAMFRDPPSKVFVLQATMRCLRQITDKQETATIFLSEDNYKILDDELNKNFNMDIKGLSDTENDKKQPFKIRLVPPPRTIPVKRIRYEYTQELKGYNAPINFGIAELDTSKYDAKIRKQNGITAGATVEEETINEAKDSLRYSAYSLAGEIAIYLNIPCSLANKILEESTDGMDRILKTLNEHNEIFRDIILPKIFNTLFNIKVNTVQYGENMVLLKEPSGGHFTFFADPELVVSADNPSITEREVKKSFHADTYCFDSRSEMDCFFQYLKENKIKEIYFTGMFTAGQGDLAIPYIDTQSKCLRHYYPDFIARFEDDRYQVIEVKGDHMLDDPVVKDKEEAAKIFTGESGVEYLMIPSSHIKRGIFMTESRNENMDFKEWSKQP